MKNRSRLLIILCAVLLCAVSAVCIFTASAAETVVYLSDGGSDSNAGTSPSAPLATLDAAYTKLGGAGTVVLVGDYTVNTDAKAQFPASDGRVSMTCVYGGVNYYQTKGATLNLRQNIHINSDMTFESIRLDQSAGTAFFCRGNNVKFGSGITPLSTVEAPSIYGGYDLSSGVFTGSITDAKIFGYTIEVCSGRWNIFNGGHYRSSESDVMGTVGGVSIIINGGTFTASGSGTRAKNVFSGVCDSSMIGDLDITVNGGDIASSLFCFGHVGQNDTQRMPGKEGNVTLTINGGTIRGQGVYLSQNPAHFLDGDFFLEINGGSFPNIKTIDGTTADGDAYQYVPASLEGMVKGFGKNVFISYANGNDNVAGSGTASLPVKTIWKAFSRLGGKGGRIIFMDEVSTGGGSVPAASGKVIMTTKLGTHDYSATGALRLSGDLKAPAPLVIENMTLTAAKEVTIFSQGHDITVGAECAVYDSTAKTVSGGDVTVNGKLNLDAGSSDDPHVIRVRSGVFENLRAGSSKRGTAVVVEGGQINGTIYGSSAKKTEGTASVKIEGGLIIGDIYASELGSETSVGICVMGGGIRSANFYCTKEGTAELFSVGAYGGKFEVTPVMDGTGAGEISVDSTVTLRKYVNKLGTQDNILFVADTLSTTANGSSPSIPRELANATKYVKTDPYKVVITENVNFNRVGVFDSNSKMTLTAFGGGCDWALTDGAKITLHAGFELSSETVIEHLDLYPVENNTFISVNGGKLTIGEYVSTEPSFVRGVEKGLSIYGGVRTGDPAPTGLDGGDITLLGGTYHRILGGNYRLHTGDTVRDMTGDININIYGGTYNSLVAATGQNNYSGNATLNIYGGQFLCPVVGLSAAYSSSVGQTVSNTADIVINVYGGEFCGDISASEDSSASLDGSYTLNLYEGADLTRVTSITGSEGLDGSSTSSINYEKALALDEEIDATIEFTNPIGGHPDPSVVLAEDGYYYYSYAATNNGKQAIYMTRSPNLCDVDNAKPRLIWTAGDNGNGADVLSIWAPQLYKFDGKWYMYASCSLSENDHAVRQVYVWKGGSAPTDAFTYCGVINNSDSSRSYSSPRFVEWAGVRYLICGSSYSIILTKLASPTSLLGSAVVISSPSADFEAAPTTTTKIMEGPVPLISPDGVLYVPYAAGHTRGDEYCTGLLKFTGSKTDELTSASKWQKFSDPMHFASYENRIYSPGAMVFVSSPDGSETWCVYHAKQYTDTAYTMRRLYLQPLEWVNGVPTVADPQSADTVFAVKANSMSVAERISGFGSETELVPAMGDLDKNYDINNADITLIVRLLSGYSDTAVHSELADLDGNGSINNRDAIALVKLLAE